MSARHFVRSSDLDLTVVDCPVADRQALLVAAAVELAVEDHGVDEVEAALQERDRLASTEISPGVLLPHAVLAMTTSVRVVVLRPETPTPGLRLMIAITVPERLEANSASALRRFMRRLADDDLLDQLAQLPPPQCLALAASLAKP